MLLEERMADATPKEEPVAKVRNFPEMANNTLDFLAEKLEADANEAAEAGEQAKSGWRKYIFDFANRDVTLPDYLVSINGVGMFARKSLTCITGRAGQGKSQTLIPLTAAPLAQRELLGVTPLRQIRHILWQDTEQEAWSISEKANRLLRLMGMPDFSHTPDKLTMLATRQAASNEERLDTIKAAIEDINPDVVIIDGITDMVTHIEDPDEAQNLVADLLKLIDERDITLFVVIHQNESGESAKLRAFVGSELMRKASNILQVSVKAGCFEIEQTKSRGVPMPLYRIRIDANGNLTDSMAENPQTEEGRLADVMGRVIERRNGSFDSKKQIYAYITATTGESATKAKKLYDRAEALEVIHSEYDGHKYKVTLSSGNAGKPNFSDGE